MLKNLSSSTLFLFLCLFLSVFKVASFDFPIVLKENMDKKYQFLCLEFSYLHLEQAKRLKKNGQNEILDIKGVLNEICKFFFSIFIVIFCQGRNIF